MGSLNPLNAKLNPICHLLALLEAHHILHIGRIRVNVPPYSEYWPKDGLVKPKYVARTMYN
jgi:hypothetical protein